MQQTEQLLFRGKRISVVRFETKVGEKSVQREVVRHPGSVVILPLLAPDRLLLIRNRRDAVGKTLLELPAGTLEKGEAPLATAFRELEEETGYQAGRIEPLSSFYTSPGYCDERMHAFVAYELTLAKQNLDAGEEIEVIEASRTQVERWIQDGTICDAKTLCALLHYFHVKC